MAHASAGAGLVRTAGGRRPLGRAGVTGAIGSAPVGVADSATAVTENACDPRADTDHSRGDRRCRSGYGGHPLPPFTEKVGTAAAFATTAEDPEINQPTIDYVAAFVPHETGKKFNPHVTVGIAPEPYLKEMLAKPFDNFAFSPAGASAYQLGNLGSARKKLHAWELSR